MFQANRVGKAIHQFKPYTNSHKPYTSSSPTQAPIQALHQIINVHPRHLVLPNLSEQREGVRGGAQKGVLRGPVVLTELAQPDAPSLPVKTQTHVIGVGSTVIAGPCMCCAAWACAA